jgi:hypothetical protein
MILETLTALEYLSTTNFTLVSCSLFAATLIHQFVLFLQYFVFMNCSCNSLNGFNLANNLLLADLKSTEYKWVLIFTKIEPRQMNQE